MKKNLKIFSLSARIFFLCCFTVWSLSSSLLMQKVSFDFSVQDESYLLSSQSISAFLIGIEANKKPKPSGGNDLRFFHSIKYLGITGIHFVKPSGNFNFIKPDDVPVISELILSTDRPRPPPVNI